MWRETLHTDRSPGRHLDKARIVALERYGHCRSRTIPMLCHDQVRLAGARRLSLVLVLTVQKDNDVTILFDTIMYINTIGDKVVRSKNCRIINCLISDTFDR